MLDETWWSEDFWIVERKLLDNCTHFINRFQLRWNLSADQINKLRSRLFSAWRNRKLLAEVQKDIISFSDYLVKKSLTNLQRESIKEWFSETYFYECVKATWITESDIYHWSCSMLRDAINIIKWEELNDISSVSEWVQEHTMRLLQSRW